MANLKVVIQHNSVELIGSFKKNLVGYANALWQHGIVPEAVKNRVLDVHSADEYQRASNLVTNLTSCFRASDDMSKQIEYMKILLNCLESEGEIELVRRMRMELKRDFKIELAPNNLLLQSGVTGSRLSSHHAPPVLDPDAVKSLATTIKEVFTSHVADLSELLQPVIREFATQMLQEGLISDTLARNPNVLYTTIIDQFMAGLPFKTEQQQIEQSCLKCLKVLSNCGFKDASEVLRNHLVKEVRTRLNIDLNLQADCLNALRHRNMPTDSAPQHHPTHKDTDDNHHTAGRIDGSENTFNGLPTNTRWLSKPYTCTIMIIILLLLVFMAYAYIKLYVYSSPPASCLG